MPVAWVRGEEVAVEDSAEAWVRGEEVAVEDSVEAWADAEARSCWPVAGSQPVSRMKTSNEHQFSRPKSKWSRPSSMPLPTGSPNSEGLVLTHGPYVGRQRTISPERALRGRSR